MKMREAVKTCLKGKKGIKSCSSIAKKHIEKTRLKIEQEHKNQKNIFNIGETLPLEQAAKIHGLHILL